jgi:hypothetical protein
MTRIFLSFPHSEMRIAELLAQAISANGIEPVLDNYEIDQGGEDILSHLLFRAHTSEFVLLLIPTDSPVAARWRRGGFSKSVRSKVRSRNISIIPIYLGSRLFSLPSSDAVSFTLERRHAGERVSQVSIDRVASYVSSLPRVKFDHLTPQSFEHLVIALLQKLKFFDIEPSRGADYGFDIQAKTRTRNPFGGAGATPWLIQLKFHKSARADIQSLQQLSYGLERQPLGVNGVLITNGQLTSTAREWVESNEKSKRTSITIVDGTQLRELVLKYPDIVDNFFGIYS